MSEALQRLKRIGVFGGAFDPIHLGHLRSALEVLQALSLDEVRFVPSGTPPHRPSARASDEHRIAMLEQSVSNTAGIVIDKRELQKTNTSYSIDTLRSIATDYPNSRLTLVIGMDQLNAFDTWFRWQDLLQGFDLAVMERPGEILSEAGRSILSDANASTNKISIIAVTQLQISSSRIREDLAAGRDIQFLVPQAVRDYINQHGLYVTT